MNNSIRIRRYVEAGFTPEQAKIIVGDLNDQQDKHDKQIKELDKQIKKLNGEILYLKAIIIHRQDLIRITDKKHGKQKIEALRQMSPWKHMTEKQIRKNKNDFSKRLHVVPPKVYKQQINNTERNFKHHINYEEKRRKTPPTFTLPPEMSKNFPKKFITARKV